MHYNIPGLVENQNDQSHRGRGDNDQSHRGREDNEQSQRGRGTTRVCKRLGFKPSFHTKDRVRNVT